MYHVLYSDHQECYKKNIIKKITRKGKCLSSTVLHLLKHFLTSGPTVQIGLQQWVGEHPIHWQAEDNKGQKKEEFTCFSPLFTDSARQPVSSSALELVSIPSAPLVLKPSSGLTPDSTMGSPESPASRQQIMRIPSLHNYMINSS